MQVMSPGFVLSPHSKMTSIDIESFITAIETPIRRSETVKWPIQSSTVTHLFLRQYTEELVGSLRLFKSDDDVVTQVSQRVAYPTSVWKLTHHLLRGFQLMGLTIDEKRSLVQLIIRILERIKAGSPFNEDGRNIIFSRTQIDQQLSLRLAEPSSRTLKLVHQLKGVLWAYLEAALFAARCEGMEVHGPYTVGAYVVMIRDYFDLELESLIPEAFALPFHTVRIVELYTKIDVDIDVFNNVTVTSDNPQGNLIAYRVSVDGTALCSDSDLGSLIDSIKAKLNQLAAYINQLDLNSQVRQYVRIFWYRKRKWRYDCRLDWRPPQTLLEEVGAMQNVHGELIRKGRLDWLEKYVFVLRA